MYLFRPQLLEPLADYSRAKFMKDLVAGVIVAIIALPLSIALARRPVFRRSRACIRPL